jgi:His-Xaa-Ser system radical SAM maturase HxsB
VLVVNEVGEYAFLNDATLRTFVTHALLPNSEVYQNLKAKHFLVDGPGDAQLNILATKYRTKKSFLEGFTKLHTFVVTLRCDHSCLYCQVSRQSVDKLTYDMSIETARRSADLMFQSPARRISVELQGGEPLLNFDLIQRLVDYIKERNQTERKDITISITSNLASLTDSILAYLKAEDIHLSTSLDGPEVLHNQNRPNGLHDSYQLTVTQLRKARAVLGADKVNALMTTTRRSLRQAKSIVDEYIRQGLPYICLRSVSPYGFATRTTKEVGYTMEEFLPFYEEAFDYILELNLLGIELVENYAKILLTKILTPFPVSYIDLQSPTGVGFGVVVYNYDGNVYASDESRMLAEMGDDTFLLGNVHRDSFEDLYRSPAMQAIAAASCVETLPGCADCAFQSYCGADPVYHHATQGHMFGHRPTSGHCTKHMAIFKVLFRKLQTADDRLLRIFFKWINGTTTCPTPAALTASRSLPILSQSMIDNKDAE